MKKSSRPWPTNAAPPAATSDLLEIEHLKKVAERVGFYPTSYSDLDSLALVGSLPQDSAYKAFNPNPQNAATDLTILTARKSD